MTANSSPNLFRLSLPEWLREQVDSKKHKGVYWINEKERIFHVPWKHASRNGWEDGDVSLFKAWAIYTNRYREGIDRPRPALWKTNFRCAINSHNSICFLKDQGQRKGDKAHRIMKLIDPPKKGRRLLNSPEDDSTEVPRKLVRLTYPNFGPPPDSKSHKAQQSSKSQNVNRDKMKNTSLLCDQCIELKRRMHFILESAIKCPQNIENNPDYLNIKAKCISWLTSKAHICNDKDINDMIENILPTLPFVPNNEAKSKPNLQDLYVIGKALQSADGSVNVIVKSEDDIHKIDVVTQAEVGNDKTVVEKIKKECHSDEDQSDVEYDDSFFRHKEVECLAISEGEDELITPRNV